MTPGWLNVRNGLMENIHPRRRGWRAPVLLLCLIACALFWLAAIVAALR
jgi:hypothetical protein